MSQNPYNNLLVSTENKVCRVVLNRPELHNAFNAELIGELHTVFEAVAERAPDQVRVVVLSGAGKSFCAGADVNWMRASLDATQSENVGDALRMAHMFDVIDRCPVPVIGRVHGACIGGGVGLAAVCDIVVVSPETKWAFSEAKLGIAPAVISTFVLPKIGQSHARALFFTAERFSAERAVQIGLAHSVVPAEGLDVEVERLVAEVLSSGPHGIARAKMLIRAAAEMSHAEAIQFTAETIAALRVGPEGQEGLKAFLEKRKAEWAT